MFEKINKSLKKDFTTMTLVLIPVAIAINIVIGQIDLLLRLPVYLDSIGTVLVGALAGPWAGALTGALTNIIWGLLIEPDLLPWWPVAMVIGAVAGICSNLGLFKTWWKVVISGLIIAISAAIVGTPIAVYLFGGITSSGSSLITAFLLQTGRDLVTSVLSVNFMVEPVDKISTALLAYAILEGMSVRYITSFPRGENVLPEKGSRTSQLVIAVVVTIVIILLYALVWLNFFG